MYNVYTIKDNFALPPENFDKNVEEVAETVLQTKYEGKVDKDIGIIVAVFNVKNVSDGMIYPGDPSTHHDAEFEVLAFLPHVDEVVCGEVTELVEFGAFMRIGPMDGLIHVSQIANEFLSYDRKTQTFVSRQKKLFLKKGDIVYAKISTVSMKNSVKDSKIALTMKQDGFGKPEWARSAAAAAGKHRKKGRGQPDRRR